MQNNVLGPQIVAQLFGSRRPGILFVDLPMERRPEVVELTRIPWELTRDSAGRTLFDVGLAVQVLPLEVLQYGVIRETLEDTARRGRGYHIVHLFAHGHEDLLVLEDEEGRDADVSGEELANLLSGGFASPPYLVFLTACHSGEVKVEREIATLWGALRQAQRTGEKGQVDVPPMGEAAYTGTAFAMLQAEVPQVIAMRYAVEEAFAFDLAEQFYRYTLLDGMPPALAMGRFRMKARRKGDRHGYRPHDWVTPVFFGGAEGVQPFKLVRRRHPNLPAVQQFVFYATSPGVKAAEIREAGNERGAFTDALLEGLKGKGKAKAWDSASQEYVVRVDRLFDFVVAVVSGKQLIVADATARQLLQMPRLSGERGAVGGSNPILARFPPEALDPEELDVVLDPEIVAAEAEVSIERDAIEVDKHTQITTLPVRFELPPKEYSVRASARQFEPEQKRWPVELYAPLRLTVRLLPKPVTTPPLPPVPSPGPGPRAPARLIVKSGDFLAPLEVADNTSNVVNVGQGRVECPALQPGFYHVRLRTPEGQLAEELHELLPGATETVQLEAPELPTTRLVNEVIGSANFSVRSDNTLEVSESSGVGALASPQLSTLLTLAGSVTTYDIGQLPAHRLRRLGLKSFRERIPAGAEGGIQVLFGVDSRTHEEALAYLSEMKLRLWPHGQPIPESFNRPEAFSAAVGLAEFSWVTQSGAHWFSIESPEQQLVVFAMTTLPGRLTILVVHRHADGRVRFFQYLPSLTPDDYSKPVDLRRLELMQRFYLSGRLDHIYLCCTQNGLSLLPAAWEGI